MPEIVVTKRIRIKKKKKERSRSRKGKRQKIMLEQFLAPQSIRLKDLAISGLGGGKGCLIQASSTWRM